MKTGLSRSALLVPAIALAGALALAPASGAFAQAAADAAQKTEVGPATVKPDGSGSTVGGVTVQTPRPRSGVADIPADRKAAFDEEAAKAEAWKRYRNSTPPFGAGTLGDAKAYPGLQALAPPANEPPAEGPVPLR